MFQDTDTAAGAQCPDELQRHLDASAVVLVVIGHDWLTARDPEGRRRIDSDDDWSVMRSSMLSPIAARSRC